MDLRLPTPHAYIVNPTLTRDGAQQQAVDKRLTIVAGGLSGLFSRPKPEEVDLAYSEFRYEAFWHVVATVRYVFERNKTFTVPVTGAEVRKVTVLGQEFEVVTPQPQQPQQSSPTGFLQQIGQQIGIAGNVTRTFSVPGVEYCIDENRQERFLDTVAGQAVQTGADYVKKDKTELTDLSVLVGRRRAGGDSADDGLQSAAHVVGDDGQADSSRQDAGRNHDHRDVRSVLPAGVCF